MLGEDSGHMTFIGLVKQTAIILSKRRSHPDRSAAVTAPAIEPSVDFQSIYRCRLIHSYGQ